MLRVGGGKDQGTRFLSFVDAMLGFRHLLTQEDLDKAASMCQGLKGHLRSRFLVLSDDRQPPPPPNKKRPFTDDSVTDPGNKRFQNEASSLPTNATSQHFSQVNQIPLGTLPNPAVNTVNAVHRFGQVQPGASSSSSVFSPSAFPPLQPLTQPAKLIVPGEGYQTVTGKGGRRTPNSTSVPGVKSRKDNPLVNANRFAGLTEELDPQFQVEDESPSEFGDALDA